jgi:hypothetical protein
MNKRYVLPQNDAWLLVRPDNGGANFSIPSYLELDLTGTRTEAGIKRDFFTILEGVHRGRKASVRWDGNKSNLSTAPFAYMGAAALLLDKNRMTLTYPGGVATVVDLSNNPIPNGLHPVQIPDFPHEGGNYYLAQSRLATCWFFLGVGVAVNDNSGRDRYLHAGSGSAGCVTMDARNWTAIYRHIIARRRGNNRDVGTLTVR